MCTNDTIHVHVWAYILCTCTLYIHNNTHTHNFEHAHVSQVQYIWIYSTCTMTLSLVLGLPLPCKARAWGHVRLNDTVMYINFNTDLCYIGNTPYRYIYTCKGYNVSLDLIQVSKKQLTFTPDTDQPSLDTCTVLIDTSFSYSSHDNWSRNRASRSLYNTGNHWTVR